MAYRRRHIRALLLCVVILSETSGHNNVTMREEWNVFWNDGGRVVGFDHQGLGVILAFESLTRLLSFSLLFQKMERYLRLHLTLIWLLSTFSLYRVLSLKYACVMANGEMYTRHQDVCAYFRKIWSSFPFPSSHYILVAGNNFITRPRSLAEDIV